MLPHFISWIVVGSFLAAILSYENGIINRMMETLGLEKVIFYSSPNYWPGILAVENIWKGVGYSTVIYLAAIAGLNTSYYEAAEIDGASRFQMMSRITLPSILYMITLLLILRIGQVMNAGFMQILNLYNPAVYDVADIIDTYVYRITFHRAPDFGYSTAVGMFKAILNFVLVISADRVAKRFGQMGIF